MSIPSFWENTYQEAKVAENKSNKDWRSRARPFTFITIVALSCLGAWSTYIIFPWITLGGVAALAIAGVAIDQLFYDKKIQNTFKLLFSKGLSLDLLEQVEFKIADDWLDKKKILLLKCKKALRPLYTKLTNQYKQKHLKTELQENDFRKIDKLFKAKLVKYFVQQRRYKAKEGEINNPAKTWLDLFDQYYQKRMKQEGNSTLQRKYFKVSLAGIFSFVTGISWACISLVEFLEIFAITSLFNPWALPFILLAGLVGTIQGLMYFKTLHGGIKSSLFDKVWNNIKYDKNHNIFVNLFKITLCTVACFFVLASLIIMTDAFLASMSEFLLLAIGNISATTNFLMEATVYINILCCALPFAVKHSTGACKKLADHLQETVDWIKDENTSKTDIKNAVIKNPLKIIVYTLVLACLLIHGITEGAIMSIKGAVSDQFWPGKLFRWMAGLLSMKADHAGAVASTGKESIEHLDLVLKNTHSWIEGKKQAPTEKVAKDKPIVDFPLAKPKVLTGKPQQQYRPKFAESGVGTTPPSIATLHFLSPKSASCASAASNPLTSPTSRQSTAIPVC